MNAVWRSGILGVLLTAGAAESGAQAPSSPSEIPSAFLPPTGMCRVWLRDVPPMQQPAPTDCRSALRTKPEGARVIYGPEPKRTGYRAADWTKAPGPRGRDDDDSTLGADEPMPSMRSAVLWTEGQRPPDMQRWFGTQNVSARFSMPARNAAPDRVQWFDADNRVVQVWTDRNGDGRADRVEIFGRDGARVRVVVGQ